MGKAEGDRDPGTLLGQRLLETLHGLEFPMDASKDLAILLSRSPGSMTLYLPRMVRIDLPTDLEDLVSLRQGRFQVHIVTGIHEKVNGDLINHVIVVMPLMGWELSNAIFDLSEGRPLPHWAEGLDEESLIEVRAGYLEEPLEVALDLRVLFPIFSTYLDPTASVEEAYRKRREVLLATVDLLCTRMGFKVHSSESGYIPKEIKDEWLVPTVLMNFEHRTSGLRSLIKDHPDDPGHLYELASLLISRDRGEEGLELLDRALGLDPHIPQFLFAKATAYSRMGRDDEADEAERKALDIQRGIGTPPSRADIYSILNPFIYDPKVLGPVEIPPEENRGLDGLPKRCEFCNYDFLDIRDGLIYECNRCGAELVIKGAALAVETEIEKEQVGPGDSILVRFHLENRTKYPMTYETDGIEIGVEPADQEKEKEKDGGTDRSRPMVFGKLKEGPGTIELGPSEKRLLEVDLNELEWTKDDSAIELELGPGSYALSIRVEVEVDPGGRGIASNTVTRPVVFEVLSDEDDGDDR